MSGKILKFGILCNSTRLPHWQAAVLNELEQHQHFKISLIIINNNPQKKQNLWQKIFTPSLLFRQYETRILKIPAKQPVAMDAKWQNIPQLKVQTTLKGKYSHYFNPTTIENIKNHELDVILRFGFGIIKGEVLNAAKYGVWGYHHGDEIEFRGGPPGFWELFYNQPTTSAILQRLSNTLDGGTVLKKGCFKTIHHSYAEQVDTLFSHTSGWVKQVALDIVYNHKSISSFTVPKGQKEVNKAPKNSVFIWFLLILLKNKIALKWNHFFRRELWNVGIGKGSIEDLIEKKCFDIDWLPQLPVHSYRADPFIAENNGNKRVYFEQYDYRLKKGHIASISLDTYTTDTKEIIALKPNTHLSYPFIFSENGTNYCLPESFENNESALYLINNHFALEKVGTLLPNSPVVDATIVFFNAKYWLFCTLKNKLPNAQLYIFYSETLLGEYRPHLLNPVKTDVTNARPAGNFIFNNGSWYRPAQNCSKTYGGSLYLNKIIVLTEFDFAEEKVLHIAPWDTLYKEGLHHLCTHNGFLIVDGKRYIYPILHGLKILLMRARKQ